MTLIVKWFYFFYYCLTLILFRTYTTLKGNIGHISHMIALIEEKNKNVTFLFF